MPDGENCWYRGEAGRVCSKTLYYTWSLKKCIAGVRSPMDKHADTVPNIVSAYTYDTTTTLRILKFGFRVARFKKNSESKL